MTLIIFIIILGILVLAHELGHFSIAKWAGVRVDEFGLGLPPRAKKLFTWKGTLFSLNWIPFGGFVRIFGENPEPEQEARYGAGYGERGGKMFTDANKFSQVAILAAGVTANVLLAFLLLTAGFIYGTPYSTSDVLGHKVVDPETTIVSVLPDSPAYEAGIRSGDEVVSIASGDRVVEEITPENVSEFIASSPSEITLNINRGGEELSMTMLASENIVSGRYALGIVMDSVGTLRLGLIDATVEGAKTTYFLLVAIVVGLYDLIIGSVRGTADLSQVTGPVGIIGVVGDASRLGLSYLTSLTAFISLNLAVINLVPFPALDGGRILFVIIEALIGKRVNRRVFNIANALGFSILITLMIVVTIRDLSNLF